MNKSKTRWNFRLYRASKKKKWFYRVGPMFFLCYDVLEHIIIMILHRSAIIYRRSGGNISVLCRVISSKASKRRFIFVVVRVRVFSIFRALNPRNSINNFSKYFTPAYFPYKQAAGNSENSLAVSKLIEKSVIVKLLIARVSRLKV